jgi:hypothetical protein
LTTGEGGLKYRQIPAKSPPFDREPKARIYDSILAVSHPREEK